MNAAAGGSSKWHQASSMQCRTMCNRHLSRALERFTAFWSRAATLPASLRRLCNALHSSHAHVAPSIVGP